MTSFEPHHTTGSGGDRTWSQRTWSRLQAIAAPVVTAVVFHTVVTTFGMAGHWFVRVVAVVLALGLVYVLVETVRAAHRVTLRRDGTLELVRPIGTARIRVEQIRAMRDSRFDDRNNNSPIRMDTDHGTYRVHRGLADLDGMVEVLRERNPRIELPSA